MRLLVTGGAGYIGSIVVERLVDGGHDVRVLDNLSTGHHGAIPDEAAFFHGDIRDREILLRALDGCEAVLHFAALSIVPDSVARPLDYFDNNVGGTVALLRGMHELGVGRIVFSSSAAVYGSPERLPILESDRCRPENPYGDSKLMVERIFEASRSAWDLSYVALRYFNAGGSTAQRGEDHDPESHLIPVVLDTILGRRESFTVFGNDYDTPDGTCIRDYIHVVDLAEAHVLALEAMNRGFSGSLNLGSDKPFTVLQVIKTVEEVSGKAVPYTFGPRRAGDPPALLASSDRATEILGWKQRHSSLNEIVRSAYEWRLAHPEGY